MSTTKLRVLTQFPAQTTVQAPLRLIKNHGKWKFSIDVTQLTLNTAFVGEPGDGVAIFNSLTNNYFFVPLPIIITTPSPLVIINTASIGTLVGYLSVFGGTGVYTFTLTNSAGGKYSISGNQLLVHGSLAVGIDAITIHADNGSGQILQLNTTVTVIPAIPVHPTYYIYGF
jgi:hypothetical protein